MSQSMVKQQWKKLCFKLIVLLVEKDLVSRNKDEIIHFPQED